MQLQETLSELLGSAGGCQAVAILAEDSSVLAIEPGEAQKPALSHLVQDDTGVARRLLGGAADVREIFLVRDAYVQLFLRSESTDQVLLVVSKDVGNFGLALFKARQMLARVMGEAASLTREPTPSKSSLGPGAAEGSGSRASRDREASAKLSAVLVDDSRACRVVGGEALEAEGYDVRLAVDGEEALALLKEKQAHLVVSDIEMPNLDGFGLLEALASDPLLEDIPVVLCSSRKEEQFREQARKLGARALVPKPVKKTVLRDVVRRVMKDRSVS